MLQSNLSLGNQAQTPSKQPWQGKAHLILTRLIWGDPPADGWLGKEGGGRGKRQTEERIDIHNACKYINYTKQSKLKLTGFNA